MISPRSLGTSLGAIFAAFVALLLVNIVVVSFFAREATDRFAVAEVAAAERALLTRLETDLVLLAEGRATPDTRTEIEELAALVDRNLDALTIGGVAQTSLGGNELSVPAATDDLRRLLDDFSQRWRPMHEAISGLPATGADEGELRAMIEPLLVDGVELRDELERVVTVSEEAFAANQETRFWFAVVLLGLAAIAVVLGWIYVRRRVVQPLVALAAMTRSVADGNLAVDVRPDGRSDEIGRLTDAFGDMTESLRASLDAERSATENLSAAANEILAAATQLTSGASQQAAAVSEISTSGEEVRVTAEAAARRAQEVADAVAKVTEVGHEGRGAIAEARRSMAELRGKVETIAERILALSEQTQAIGEITSSVDELADQTNLLAVNAAIEAAKAGEHGRGFAVVAQEVRNLADQSRLATEQIRTILGQIQKSAHGAVLVTEDGSRGVEAGSRLVDQAGEVIEQLVATLGDSATLAREIAISSEQQRAGVDQVASGIGDIDEVSRQTAAAARQLQTEAEGLTGLADQLRSLARRFQLSREPAHSAEWLAARELREA